MKTDIEGTIQKKENIEQKKENIEQKEKKDNIEQKEKKEKKTTKTSRDQASVIKNFIGKEVAITLRNGNNLKGKLETVSQYELIVTMSYVPIIVMKHAVDYIALAGEK